MNYTIDGCIIFREDDGKLWNIINPEQSVRLSVIPAKILSYLIVNKENIVNRNDLLENIWDKNGLQASNNSLSQNISILRKILQDLGCDNDVIITLPKIGYRINESITIDVEEEIDSEIVVLDEEQIISNISNDNELIPEKRYQYNTVILAISLAISLLIVIVSFYAITESYQMQRANLFPIGKIDSCTINTLNSIPSERVDQNMQSAAVLINKYLPCIKSASFIFRPDSHYLHNGLGRVFLSRCIPSSSNDHSFSSCQDLYIHER